MKSKATMLASPTAYRRRLRSRSEKAPHNLDRTLRRSCISPEQPALAGPDTEPGFTLIELMVVLLIMAILLAIAIPTFLGVRHSAQDRATQSNLRNALNAVKQLYTKSGNASYLGLTSTALASIEPSLNYYVNAAVPATGNKNAVSIQVSPTSGQWVMLAAWSPDNRCWFLEDNEQNSSTTTALIQAAGTWYGVALGVTKPSNCNAATSPLKAIPLGSPLPTGSASSNATAATPAWGNSF
jgi:type IV pilus assembly protein PilA